jgi:CheY-like chemotaxis protein
MNLCVNAMEATPEGGVITLGTRRLGDTVELSVMDNGCGMDSGVLRRAPEPFFTTKPEGKGTGLGLSMVYGVVKAHGGEMKLESGRGRGTTVTITFPAAAAPKAAPPSAAGGAPRSRARGLKILVVDDDSAVRIAFSILLEALGHFPTAVSSGEAALEAIEGGAEADLVILDLSMPGLGGAGTLPRLRELRPALSVILATGRADQNAVELVESLPGVRIMEKPFNREELEAALEALPVAEKV